MSKLEPSCALFHVPALDCPAELGPIEKGLSRLAGVTVLTPNYLARQLRVEFDARQVDAETIAARIREIGFPVEPVAQAAPSPQSAPETIRWSTVAGGVLLVAAAAARWTAGSATVAVAALAVASTIASGLPVARAGLRAARLRALDMNALMTIAAAGALATGDYFEAATAMFLFGVSLGLERFSLGRARRAVRSLVELTPTVAHRIDVAGLSEIEPALLAAGDRLLVKPGERVPVDGVVDKGHSLVNQAPITGESAAVEKLAGDLVYAGTLNGEGSLEVRATRTAHESTLAHIARLVDQAQQARSPTERFVDQFARRYTPAVIALAVLIAAVPPLLAQAGVGWAAAYPAVEWLHRGLVLLVIACPCALVISTPVTIVCGLHQGARRGLLIKGGEHLENAGRIDCVAFDKTGTLTTGEAEVVRVVPARGYSVTEVLCVAAALESHSEHPFGRAIVAAARRHDLSWGEISRFQALRGSGVQGTYEGQTCYVGSPRLFRDQRLGGPEAERDWLGEAAAGGPALTTALVGTPERMLGAILLADRPRDDAARAIAELKALGVGPIVMLSGDQRAVAQRMAAELGVDEVRAELLPQDKVEQVARLSRRYPRMAMVGDGVNDAPALVASRLGIALGSQSSDLALETADVVVMSPCVRRVPELVRLGRSCRRLLAQNIGLALSTKAAVLWLAVAGPPELARLWMAVAADVGASLLVIANGMRLLK